MSPIPPTQDIFHPCAQSQKTDIHYFHGFNIRRHFKSRLFNNAKKAMLNKHYSKNKTLLLVPEPAEVQNPKTNQLSINLINLKTATVIKT